MFSVVYKVSDDKLYLPLLDHFIRLSYWATCYSAIERDLFFYHVTVQRPQIRF